MLILDKFIEICEGHNFIVVESIVKENFKSGL